MEILLIQNVPTLGARGDVVNVKDGYARNFLLPRKLALPVTAGNKRLIELEKERNLKMRAKELADAQALAPGWKPSRSPSPRRSATAAPCSDRSPMWTWPICSRPRDSKLEKQSITLPHVKTIGTYEVDIRLYSGVHAKLPIEVTALAAE